MKPDDVSPWVVRGLYLFALVLIASPIIDLLTTAWPPRPADLPWRYGFVGLAAGYLHTPILGFVLAAGVAYWQGHASALRTLGVLAAVAAVLLVPVLVLWPLDVLQMRALREAEARSGVLIGGVIQELKYAGAFLVLGCLALGAAPTARRIPRSSGAAGIVARSHG